MKSVVFYTLMLFDSNKKVTGYNGLSSSYDENVKIYVNQCLLLKLSLKNFGYNLRIVTNDIKKLISLSSGHLNETDLIYLPLSSIIPSHTNFYLSFHKFELINYLVSKNIDHYAFIIDNDVVCLRSISQNLKNIVNKGITSYYDISDQHIPAFGLDNVIRDVSKIDSSCNLGIWCGGEFFGSDIIGLKFIKTCFDEFRIKYFDVYNDLNQKSDENIYTLSIQKMIFQNISFYDVGKIFAISRFWSVKTAHIPDLWRKAKSSYLLHLPADKYFLSNYFLENSVEFSPDNFVNEYEKYLIGQRGWNLNYDFYNQSLFRRVIKKVSNVFINSLK